MLVVAARPVYHLGVGRGCYTAGEVCLMLDAEGWSLWGPSGLNHQPLCNAVVLSMLCPGADCSLLLQFLTVICGQGSTWRDTKPVTSALHS